MRIVTDPIEAVAGADCVVTDTWVSMGDADTTDRHNMLRAFQVDDRLMAAAKPGAIFMHCLPAHRGEEMTAERDRRPARRWCGTKPRTACTPSRAFCSGASV